MKNVFPIIENPYDLRNKMKFDSKNVHIVQYGIGTASFVSEFGATFQEDTKNLVLLMNLRQKLSLEIQNTAHANFAKITYIK